MKQPLLDQYARESIYLNSTIGQNCLVYLGFCHLCRDIRNLFKKQRYYAVSQFAYAQNELIFLKIKSPDLWIYVFNKSNASKFTEKEFKNLKLPFVKIPVRK